MLQTMLFQKSTSCLVDTDDDDSFVQSPKYGEDKLFEDKQVSWETCELFCHLLPKCMPFNSHIHARRTDSSVLNCWCPCAPDIRKWLVSEIPAIDKWFSHCDSKDKYIQFPMTAKDTHKHLRNVDCNLHRLADYYVTVLMTYYEDEVKKK